ncbi:MAG: PDZ domain-containing protein [Planctomycetes bacterium]|nr:PDZ domain-containing protein [Planctomycetota bacterium]
MFAQNASQAQPPELPPSQATAQRSVDDWVRDLGADSYKQRVAAERALRQLGDSALDALKSAAASSTDPEVQWRSKRLVRQIENGDDRSGRIEERRPGDASPGAPRQGGQQDPRQQPPQAGRPFPDARDQFEDMFHRLERDFGVDIPRGHFFRDDFFQDLDQQFRDLRSMQQRLLQGQMPQGQGMPGLSQGMSVQVGPDGVRVEVEEQNEKGETEKKVYEAPDMQTFREKYPDVLKDRGLMLGDGNGNFGFRAFGPGFFREEGLPDAWRTFGRSNPNYFAPDAGNDPAIAPVPMTTPPPAGERLGVYVRDAVPDAVRDYLGLGADRGLMIQSVQDGSLAAQLGLRADDILTGIGGTTIGSPADVRQALGAIAAGEDVEATWIRKGREQTATVRKPAIADATPDAGEKGAVIERLDKKGRIERR